jgi:hypothetical protein
MTDTQQLIAQGRELFEATTPGEWWAQKHGSQSYVMYAAGGTHPEICVMTETGVTKNEYEADAAFIAWAHNNFSVLADAAERLEAELQVLRAEKKAAEDYWRNFRESMNQSASSSPAPEWMKNVETF